MIAAIGTDGTRPVVWGLGGDERDAADDAAHWLENDGTLLVFVEVDRNAVNHIRTGIVDLERLGIALTPEQVREITP